MAAARFTLAVDVGNSRFKLGLFEHATSVPGELPGCAEALAVPLADDIPWDVVRAWDGRVEADSLQGVVAGANPAGVRKVLASWPADRWPAPRVVDDPTRFPIRIGVDSPATVGIDRLLNAVACNVLRPEGTPAIIVDTGTATTVDYLSAAGVFEGGAILPGFELAAHSLHLYTALLPSIPMQELAETDNHPLGRDTRSAMRSGLFWGQLGAVRELVRQYRDLGDLDPFVVLTGGGSPLLAEHFPQARCEPHLALQGLVLVTTEDA